jgi:aryl-alcohol dehydrogenase-like predicted oxidoreductase
MVQALEASPKRLKTDYIDLYVARKSGYSPAQVALAWLRQRPEPVIPIIGARKWRRSRTTSHVSP